MAKVSLDGVPETMLWPLWNRAYEAKRKDRLIDDPWSINLVEDIEYDFAASFKKPNRGHGIRSRVGDDLVSDFLTRHGEAACVVALGEGLETQYWRLGEPNVPWFSVDVSAAIDVRQSLLPQGKSMTPLAYSALDTGWMDEVPTGLTPFVSMMGLLMYFTKSDVINLLTEIAERFPGAEIFFDAIPPWFSKRTMEGYDLTESYRTPKMPWGISIERLPAFVRAIPNMEPVTIQTYAKPYPQAMRVYSILSLIRPMRNRLAPSLVHARVQDRQRE
ncbi:MAG: class I SAM-dependent methyltransferase [Pseudomonadota bacterium]